MIETIVFGYAVVIATLVAVFVSYWFARKLAKNDVNTSTEDMAGSIVFRLSALHGLIIALVFAQLATGVSDDGHLGEVLETLRQ